MVSNKVYEIDDRRLSFRALPSICLFILLISGCASTKESPFLRLDTCKKPAPYWVAVLPPEINPDLRLDDFKSEGFWLTRMLTGSGSSYTTLTPEKDIRLGLVSELSCAKIFNGVFAADSVEEAKELNADLVLNVYVEDYRTVLVGPNRRHLYVVTNPLPIQYFIRSLTLEGRAHWDMDLVSVDSGKSVFKSSKSCQYRKTVRFALPKYFAQKAVNYLTYDVLPTYVYDCFSPENVKISAE